MTKRASGGEKTTIEFSTYVAMQSVAKKLDVLTAEQFRSVINDYIDMKINMIWALQIGLRK